MSENTPNNTTCATKSLFLEITSLKLPFILQHTKYKRLSIYKQFPLIHGGTELQSQTLSLQPGNAYNAADLSISSFTATIVMRILAAQLKCSLLSSLFTRSHLPSNYLATYSICMFFAYVSPHGDRTR